jgi:transcriptional regulator with XRE-family HTH domain
MYPNLKLQIWKLGVRQNRLAQMVGIHETLLSKIINGFRAPDSQMRARIATILQSDETWLFTSNNGIHAAPAKSDGAQRGQRRNRRSA